MKIVQVIPVFKMAGAEIMCENLIYELLHLGNQVTAVSLYSETSDITKRLEQHGVCIHYLGKHSGFDPSLFKKLSKIFKDEQPDIIHTHLYASKYVFPCAAKLHIGVVHTIHNLAHKDNSRSGRLINKFYFKHGNVTPVALGTAVKESIIREYGLKESDIPTVCNGIDLSKCIIKTDYSIDGNFKILHIGRFSEQKNHYGLIRAFDKFHSKHNNSELWLIGDGETKKETEEYVGEHGLSSCVSFVGLSDNVFPYLASCDIFALPSLYEGVPMTLIEAMGSGLPIVASPVGGVCDMLNRNSSLLVRPDIDEIADAFEAYYSDEELRKRHGHEALKLSAAFSAEQMARNYSEVYRRRYQNGKT